jgi:putative transposase
MRCTNRVEQAHQPTRVLERVMGRLMGRFRSSPSAQRFLETLTRVGNPFRPRRHLLSAGAYRAVVRERVATWRTATGLHPA